MFKAKDKVTVNDPASPDNGKHGIVQSHDADAETCSVLLDGDSSPKDFECGKLTKAKP